MKSHVDWLRFRTQSGPYEVLDKLKPAFCGGLVELGDQQKGKDGWEFRRPLVLADVAVGSIDYGGESQRGWSRIDFSGEGCKWIFDWDLFYEGALDLKRAEIRRLDLALDTYDSSVTHALCVAAYEGGGFTNGGRMPKAKEVLPRKGGEGRTFYVGRREGPRFFRCYEKGWQMWEKFPETVRAFGPPTKLIVLGREVHPDAWYRCEVELKAVDGYFPPWAALKDPDGYFSGSCPFFSSLLPGAEPRPLAKVMPDFSAKLELQASLEYLRVAYGGVIRAALMAGMTEAELMKTIVSERPSERLVKAGVLMIDAGA